MAAPQEDILRSIFYWRATHKVITQKYCVSTGQQESRFLGFHARTGSLSSYSAALNNTTGKYFAKRQLSVYLSDEEVQCDNVPFFQNYRVLYPNLCKMRFETPPPVSPHGDIFVEGLTIP